MKSTKSASKEVTIVARVQFKNDARKVVYKVLSSNGKDTYETYFFNGKACSCSCPATKPCYHMVQCEAREQARKVEAVVAINASANLRYAYGYHD